MKDAIQGNPGFEKQNSALTVNTFGIGSLLGTDTGVSGSSVLEDSDSDDLLLPLDDPSQHSSLAYKTQVITVLLTIHRVQGSRKMDFKVDVNFTTSITSINDFLLINKYIFYIYKIIDKYIFSVCSWVITGQFMNSNFFLAEILFC